MTALEMVAMWPEADETKSYQPVEAAEEILHWIGSDMMFRTSYLQHTRLTEWMGEFWYYQRSMQDRGLSAIITQPSEFPEYIRLPQDSELNPTPADIHGIAIPENFPDLLLHQPLNQVVKLVQAVTIAHRQTTEGTHPQLITNEETIQQSVDYRTENLMHVLTKSKADPNKRLAKLLAEKLGIRPELEHQLALA